MSDLAAMENPHFLVHRAFKEGEPFDLDPTWRIIDAEYDAPWFYLVLLCRMPQSDGDRSGEVGSAVDSDRSAQGNTHPGPPPPSDQPDATVREEP